MEVNLEVLDVGTAEEFADYVMDELGRWIASDCPILFEFRQLRTEMFPSLEAPNLDYNPIDLKFAKNGVVIIKVSKSKNYSDILVTRFAVANPDLRNNIVSCVSNMENGDFGDFIGIKEAQNQWRR